MTDQAIIDASVESQGEPPKRVSAEEYLEKYAHDHYEWDNGELIQLTPVTMWHHNLAAYLYKFFDAYFVIRPIGVVMQAPFMMRIDAVGTKREPDLQIILNDNPGQLTQTAMIGPSDVCIEIVSPESVERDYGKKHAEYEQAGVKEYWLLDYERQGAHFYRLGEKGLYHLHTADADGNYESPLRVGLKVHVPTLWSDPLPDYFAIGESVRAMLEE